MKGNKEALKEKKETWIFTFGHGQLHEGRFVKFYGTFGEARSKMIDRFGAEWGFQYSEDEWENWKRCRPSYIRLEKELVLDE